MIRHWRAARGEGGGWLYSPAAPAFFISGGYCCRPRPTDVVITTGNGAVTPYLRTTQTWNGTAWTTRTDIPLPGRFSAAGTYLNGLLHVTGGLGPAPLDTHHQWNPPTDSWSTQLPVPLPRRYEHSAIELNGSLFLWGGRASTSSILSTVHEFRQGTWITGMPVPGPSRSGARALPINGRGYLFTGEIGPGLYTTRTDAFDPATQSWSTKQPLTPPGRQGCGGFVVDNTSIIFGGGRPVTTRAEQYAANTDSWSSLIQIPNPARQGVTSPTRAHVSGSVAIGGDDAATIPLRLHLGHSIGAWYSMTDITIESRRFSTGG